jgi:hypothetical protein
MVATVFARARWGLLGLMCALPLLLVAPAKAARPGSTRVCGPVLAGFAHCNAATVHSPKLKAHAALGSTPYGPEDIQSAYGLTSIAADYGADQTVAIVDAYDLPTAEADLATYRSFYGLRPCTTANGCFRKVNQNGVAGSYPVHDQDWGGEIALDLDAVSATCPHCHILLVEASSASMFNLATAVNTAASMGATQISNSYGGNEFPTETGIESYYNHPGVAVTVSTGDDGYGVQFPAASRYVTAVGGTSLVPDSSTRGWSESAWDGAGSGCSNYVPKPDWQTDTDCLTRSVADVSAVADPYTGLHTYDSDYGWEQVGGTSLASPVVAATYALTGSAASGSGYAYDNTDRFTDVTSGSNGTCTFSYLCTALTGFDGPTGVGTPYAAFPTGPPPPDTGGSSTSGPSGTGGGGNTGGGSPPPPPAPPATTPIARSSVLVSRSRVRASRGGSVRVRVRCGAGPACSGRLTLQTRLHGTSVRVLGRAHFSVRSRRSALVRVRLWRSSLRLLKRKHSLLVFGTAADHDGTSAQSSFRLLAPKHPKRRHRAHRRR